MDRTLKKELLDKYLNNYLTKAEKQLFEDLRTKDAAIQEEIDFFERFNKVQMLFGRDNLKATLTELEDELQKEEAPSLLTQFAAGLQGVVKKIHYSIEELAELFRIEPEYHAALAYGNRSDTLELVSPENGVDASIEGSLKFQLKEELNIPIRLFIENNQKQPVLSESILPATAHFSVDVSEWKPGRYYWKLGVSKKVLIREFFIQKDLMPINPK